MIKLKILQRPPLDAIAKQLVFGTAKGLTDTAKEGQAASVAAIKGTFTTRGSWFQQSNKFGIKITPATKYKLTAEVKTQADWLNIHEEGGNKTPQGSNLAIPTDQVRRNKRMIIPKGQRPKGLGSKAFILQSRKGPVLVQRLTRGKRKGLIVLYGLEKKVKIRKQSTFYEPIRKVVDRRLAKNIAAGIDFAIKTAR